MSDRVWTQITIGGSVSPTIWKKLIEAFHKDGFPADENDIKDDYLIVTDEEGSGVFEHAENVCHRRKIPFIRSSGSNYEFSASQRAFIPGVIDQDMDMDHDGGQVMIPAIVLQGLTEALSKVNQASAPLFVNDDTAVIREYAAHILAGRDPLEFVREVLEEQVPMRVPPLPEFKLLKGK